MAEEKSIEKKQGEQVPVSHAPEAAFEAPEAVEGNDQKQDDLKALQEAVEKTDIDDSLKLQAAGHAQSVRDAPETERVKKLIDIAAAKGIAYAVHVAQKAEDAYLVDALHDALAQGGLYKKFKL